MLFIATVKYNKPQENGVIKTVKEQYMFDALSYTECEARVIEELTPYISGEFTIDAIKKCRVSEIFNGGSDADKWYKAKIAFITLDEKTAQEKKSISTMLIRADNFGEACDKLIEGMHGTVSDWDLISVGETPILDYFPEKLG